MQAGPSGGSFLASFTLLRHRFDPFSSSVGLSITLSFALTNASPIACSDPSTSGIPSSKYELSVLSPLACPLF